MKKNNNISKLLNKQHKLTKNDKELKKTKILDLFNILYK